MLQKLFISDKYWSLDPSIPQRKMYSTVLNLDNNNSLKSYLRTSRYFIRDTEDWSNDAELHFKICSNIKQLFLVQVFHNITAFDVFWIK